MLPGLVAVAALNFAQAPGSQASGGRQAGATMSPVLPCSELVELESLRCPQRHPELSMTVVGLEQVPGEAVPQVTLGISTRAPGCSSVRLLTRRCSRRLPRTPRHRHRQRPRHRPRVQLPHPLQPGSQLPPQPLLQLPLPQLRAGRQLIQEPNITVPHCWMRLHSRCALMIMMYC